jgi:heat shock transcription factor 1
MEKGLKKTTKKFAVPSFITKLYQILENPELESIIKWTNNGRAFVIRSMTDFVNEVLPVYFKHSNFASFVRQLNMYDFHKTRNASKESTFQHKLFLRGKKNYLKYIKRKLSKNYCEYTKFLKSEKITSLEKMTNNKTKRRQNLERVYNNILKNLESLSSKQKILEEKVSKMTKSIEDKNLENYGNFENIEMFDESLVNSLHNSTDKKTIDDEKMKILTNLLSTRIDQSNTYLDNLNSAFQSQNENKVTPHNSSNNVSSSYSYYSGDIEIVSNNSNSNSNSNANSPTNRSKLDTILSSSSLSNTKAFTLNSTNDNNYNDIFQYKTGSPYSEDYDNLSL